MEYLSIPYREWFAQRVRVTRGGTVYGEAAHYAPNLEVVVLLGAGARDGWRSSGLLRRTGAEVFVGASPSPSGINRQRNLELFEGAMRSAAEVILG